MLNFMNDDDTCAPSACSLHMCACVCVFVVLYFVVLSDLCLYIYGL